MKPTIETFQNGLFILFAQSDPAVIKKSMRPGWATFSGRGKRFPAPSSRGEAEAGAGLGEACPRGARPPRTRYLGARALPGHAPLGGEGARPPPALLGPSPPLLREGEAVAGQPPPEQPGGFCCSSAG